MRSLRDIQEQFAGGILREDADIHSAIVAHGIEPSRRLNIYRNNAREGFLKALEATFPVIVRLAGLDWFRQTGVRYMRAYPSVSGNLHYIGRHFATFLDERIGESEYAYFGDVARLEWAYQEVLVASEHAPLDPSALSTVEPDRYGALRFESHPALRLVASAYPLLAIWQANRANSSNELAIDLSAGPNHLLVIRRDDHVELRDMPVGEFALLSSFAEGDTLQNAADAALAAQDSVDFGTALARLINLGTLVDFSIDANH